ncbi:MAG: hypothetical protein AVDCRST_MAG71-1441, partial [uncultured Lysobacter sp.]
APQLRQRPVQARRDQRHGPRRFRAPRASAHMSAVQRL